MLVMTLKECIEQLNWFSILIILIFAGLVDYFIGVQKDKKIMEKIQKELYSLEEIKENVKDIKNKIS